MSSADEAFPGGRTIETNYGCPGRAGAYDGRLFCAWRGSGVFGGNLPGGEEHVFYSPGAVKWGEEFHRDTSPPLAPTPSGPLWVSGTPMARVRHTLAPPGAPRVSVPQGDDLHLKERGGGYLNCLEKNKSKQIGWGGKRWAMMIGC